MSEIKGFDKEKLKKKQRMAMIKVPHIQFDFGQIRKACEAADEFADSIRTEVEKRMKEELDNIEIANICEMAIAYLDMVQKDNDRYNQGLQDAWELAKKIAMEKSNGGFDSYEIADIFGFNDMDAIFMSYTPQEALAKLKAYEEAQEEIKVGDVVEVKVVNKSIPFVIIAIYGERTWGYEIGESEFEIPLQDITKLTMKKTGKHIDIQSVLKQIK